MLTYCENLRPNEEDQKLLNRYNDLIERAHIAREKCFDIIIKEKTKLMKGVTLYNLTTDEIVGEIIEAFRVEENFDIHYKYKDKKGNIRRTCTFNNPIRYAENKIYGTKQDYIDNLKKKLRDVEG